MTRRIFVFGEECNNEELNAIVDDLGLVQIVAAHPYGELDTPYTSIVPGTADSVASDGSTALLYSLRIAPVRGDQIWVRYFFDTDVPNGPASSATITYRLTNLAGAVLGEQSFVHANTQTKTLKTDVIDAGNMAGVDLSGLTVKLKVFAFWDTNVEWFDAIKFTNFNADRYLQLMSQRNDAGRIYVFDELKEFYFWDDANAHDNWSPLRNTANQVHTGRWAFNGNWGSFVFGGSTSSGAIYGRIKTNDHYTVSTGLEDFGNVPGTKMNNAVLIHAKGVVSKLDSFVCINPHSDAAAPYATVGSIWENIYSGLASGTPTWGTQRTVLNGDGTDTWFPRTDILHPAWPTVVDPRIEDVWLISNNPLSANPNPDQHYFMYVRYVDGTNTSTVVGWQFGEQELEVIDELQDWQDYNASDPSYGIGSPAIGPLGTSNLGPSYACWRHIWNAADDNDIALVVIRRDPSLTYGTDLAWSTEVIEEWTGLTDAQFASWGFSRRELGSYQTDGSTICDYAYDKTGNEHIVYPRWDGSAFEIFYRTKNNATGSGWTAEEKISLGTDWTSYVATAINQIAILKDGSSVPWPGAELRVAWTASKSGARDVFMTGKRATFAEDAINVYSPTVGMNDRDDTAGPQDMLW